MTNKQVEKFLDANAEFASNYSPGPTLDQIRQKMQASGSSGAAIIVSCMDPRVIPERFLGLANNPAPVIRNAGGRVLDAARSIHVLNTLASVGLVIIVHHTDCGTTHVSDAQVRDTIRKSGSKVTDSVLEDIKFGEILNLEKSIREDVKALREDPLFGDHVPEIVGFLYDVDTGKLKQVDF